MGLSPFPINIPSVQDDEASPSLGDLARANGPDLKRDPEAGQDATWFHPDVIDAKRWDSHYPFQFLVLYRQDDGTYRRRGQWVFTLPIPPESMVISLQPAATVTVTQGGIVEELAGIPLQQIDLQGTVGVLPVRPQGGQAARSPFLTSVFAGTIAGIGRVAAAGSSALDDLTGDAKRSTNLIPDDLLDNQDAGTSLLRNTGYYQARTMMRFLECYFNLRRSAKGARAVLAFAAWKQEAVYLVTPTRPPSLRKAADSPFEFRYSIPLTAWGRVRLDGPGATRNVAVQDGQEPSALAAVLNTLVDARQVLLAARATVQAVIADVDHAVLEPIREAILLVKDALGIPLALIDLPAAIVKDTASTVIAAYAAGEDVADFGNAVSAEARATDRSIQDDIARIKALGAEVRDRTTVEASVGAVRGQTLAGGVASRVRPSIDLFDQPTAHAGIMAALRPDRLRLPLTVAARINAERQRVRDLSRSDLVARAGDLETAGAAFDDLVGAGDAAAATALGRGPPQATRPLTVTGARVSAALSEAAVAYAQLASRSPTVADAGPAAALQAFASRSIAAGTPFALPRSKFPAPLPYGSTLEQIAQRYLGSPDRVGEIIALNGLRSPYVDEVGARMSLLAPGAGRTVVVADVPGLYVGQTAWVESDAAPRTKRRITSITRLNGQATLVLDGAEDLDRYQTVQGASLHVFAPGTVNSQMLIWIPSDTEPDGSFRVAGIAEAAVFDPLVSAGGVDLLLTPQNDLVVTPDGDGRWAVGLTALTQLFRILVELRRGTLLDHPDRGLPLRVGDSIADVDPTTAARALRETLAAEPAFGVITAVRVSTAAPVARIDAAVQVGGGSLTVPLSAELSR